MGNRKATKDGIHHRRSRHRNAAELVAIVPTKPGYGNTFQGRPGGDGQDGTDRVEVEGRTDEIVGEPVRIGVPGEVHAVAVRALVEEVL